MSEGLGNVSYHNLPPTHREFQRIRTEFGRHQTHNEFWLDVKKIIEINNEIAAKNMRENLPQTSLKYLRKHCLILYHGSSVKNIQSILNSEFSGFKLDARGVGGLHGAGLYFASDPCKAFYYSGQKRGGQVTNNCLMRCLVYLKPDEPGKFKWSQNRIYDEYCVYSANHILITHIVEVERQHIRNKKR